MDKGIYGLVFQNPVCTVTVGALGPVMFAAGWHIYVGSALGSGGLARLDRHIALAARRDKMPKWHVDYLLTSDHFSLRYAIAAVTTNPLECDLARVIGDSGVPGFGCSDCDCPSHLFYRNRDPAEEIRDAFRSLQLAPATKTLKNTYYRNGIL
jgi:Uri superfamily endonuclease